MIDSGDDFGGAPGAGVGVGAGAMTNMGAAGSRGGRPSKGGAPMRAGAPSNGGFVTGGTGFAGSFPVAGTFSGGGGCACPVVDCPPGWTMVPDPNGCCFQCVPGCLEIPCPGVACGPGSHPEMIPGECCPTCVADSCQLQRANYEDYKRQLLEKYQQGCMINEDCTYYYEKNNCAVGCGVPVLVTTLGYLDSNLQSYAQTTCSPGCMQPIPPCEPAAKPYCSMGRCQ